LEGKVKLLTETNEKLVKEMRDAAAAGGTPFAALFTPEARHNFDAWRETLVARVQEHSAEALKHAQYQYDNLKPTLISAKKDVIIKSKNNSFSTLLSSRSY